MCSNPLSTEVAGRELAAYVRAPKFRREELEQEGAPESKLYYPAKADVFCDLRLEELI